MTISNIKGNTLIAEPTDIEPVGSAGELYYNQGSKLYYYHNDTEWIEVGSKADSTILNTGSLAIDLIHYWKFDTETNTQPDSVGSNNLIVSNAVYSSSGKINGTYLYQNSSDYMTGSTLNDEIGGIANFSINLWIKFIDCDDLSMICSSRNPSINSYQFQICYNVSTNILKFISTDNVDSIEISSIEEDTWYMITYVKNGTTASAYIDGSLSDTGATGATLPDSEYIFYVGRQNYLGNQSMDGNIDEFGMWTKALTQTEITSLYNSGHGLQYPFDRRLQINIGDSWKKMTDAKINIGDTWKDVDSIKINIGDSWKGV